MNTAVLTTRRAESQWGWVTAAAGGFLTPRKAASSAVVGAFMTAMGSNAVEAGLSMIHWCAVVMLREGKCMHIPQVSEGNKHKHPLLLR